jgi:hypothetical protein
MPGLSPTERNTGVIALIGSGVVAASVFMPYINAGSGIFTSNRTPFQFGQYGQFSDNGFYVLFGALLIALSALHFLKVLFPKRKASPWSLAISCIASAVLIAGSWQTSDWTRTVHRAYGGAVGYCGVAIAVVALITYFSSGNSEKLD